MAEREVADHVILLETGRDRGHAGTYWWNLIKTYGQEFKVKDQFL